MGFITVVILIFLSQTSVYGDAQTDAELKRLRSHLAELRDQILQQNDWDYSSFCGAIIQLVICITISVMLLRYTGPAGTAKTQPQPEYCFLTTLFQDKRQLQKGDVIKYDDVITNIGNIYDKESGQFKCPVPGTYMFNFSVMAAESNYIEASLVVNKSTMVKALSDHTEKDTTWDMGTTTAILQLDKDDLVSVAVNYPNKENTLHGRKFNTFSGCLLRAK